LITVTIFVGPLFTIYTRRVWSPVTLPHVPVVDYGDRSHVTVAGCWTLRYVVTQTGDSPRAVPTLFVGRTPSPRYVAHGWLIPTRWTLLRLRYRLTGPVPHTLRDRSVVTDVTFITDDRCWALICVDVGRLVERTVCPGPGWFTHVVPHG